MVGKKKERKKKIRCETAGESCLTSAEMRGCVRWLKVLYLVTNLPTYFYVCRTVLYICRYSKYDMLYTRGPALYVYEAGT